MRRIELKTIEMGVHGGQKWPPLDFATAICDIVDRSVEGMMIHELRQCLRVTDATKAAAASTDRVLLLEEEDWRYLCERIAKHRFPVSDAAILTFADAIEKAESA